MLISLLRWSGHFAFWMGLLQYLMPLLVLRLITAYMLPFDRYILWSIRACSEYTCFCCLESSNRRRLWLCGGKQRSTMSHVFVSLIRWISLQQSEWLNSLSVFTFLKMNFLKVSRKQLFICFFQLYSFNWKHKTEVKGQSSPAAGSEKINDINDTVHSSSIKL